MPANPLNLSIAPPPAIREAAEILVRSIGGKHQNRHRILLVSCWIGIRRLFQHPEEFEAWRAEVEWIRLHGELPPQLGVAIGPVELEEVPSDG